MLSHSKPDILREELFTVGQRVLDALAEEARLCHEDFRGEPGNSGHLKALRASIGRLADDYVAVVRLYLDASE